MSGSEVEPIRKWSPHCINEVGRTLKGKGPIKKDIAIPVKIND